ncbi:MAG TPA: fibronectin type III domain-containing protein [Puia sp.]|nr:fibronectin type III domain-containing protein [Puia sp.]
MKQPKLLTNFSKFNDVEFENKAQVIYAGMNGNASFPAPSPNLTEVITAIQDYSGALAAAKSRDKVKVSIKNDMRNALEQVLLSLAGYVSFTADGDRTKLTSSGYDLSKESNSPVPLGTPQNFTVGVGQNSGEATVDMDSVKGAKAYTHMYALAPVTNDAWIVAISSTPGYTFTGLEPMKQYSFRIGVAGSKGQVAYTDIITKMVV